jgi:predicted permease
VKGVVSAGAVCDLPFGGGSGSRYFTIEGHPSKPAGQGDNANINAATPDYFRTLGIPLVRGREFNSGDVLGKPEVVIINQEAARRFWPDEDPIGTRIRIGDQTWRTVVGVIGDARQGSLDVDPRQELYFPYAQQPYRRATIAIRGEGDVEDLANAIRAQVQSVDRALPVFDVKTMNQLIDESVSPKRFSMTVLVIFAVFALVLATVGVYAVMSYSVEKRVHEIGIRMALGAEAGDVLRLVLRNGITLAVPGIAIGVVASFGVTRLVSNLLFGIGATDPLTFVSISTLLLIVALLACYIPARRASRVDPMVALRIE